MKQQHPKAKARSTNAPPTATPAIAPVESVFDEPPADPVALGIARVGVRVATEAFSPKKTAKSPEPALNPPLGADIVAPPLGPPPTTAITSGGTT
jgi:hypothetical protein